MQKGPIGVFDSGFGGLTILDAFIQELPDNQFYYLGDNARAPYGSRSFEVIHQYTLEALHFLFTAGCPLVILACNTASAKALRTIQQRDLPKYWPNRNVLGVIRPTTEQIGLWTKTRRVGILGTTGTVKSDSYKIEIEKFFPDITVYQQACPMLVPLIENQETHSKAMPWFIKQYTDALFQLDSNIDTVVLACTHYPLIESQIIQQIGARAQVISQGKLVAKALKTYLQRHSKTNALCNQNLHHRYFTTEDNELFNSMASYFLNRQVLSEHVQLNSNFLLNGHTH
jgi:glutamate racemase